MIDFIDIGVNYTIEMIAAWQYFRSFYSSKCSKQAERILMASAYIILFGLFWLRILWLNAIGFWIINYFLCFYLFSHRISASAFHGLILSGSMAVTELIVELISMKIFIHIFRGYIDVRFCHYQDALRRRRKRC